MITLKNEYLTASFSELGGELKSLIYEGNECIWQGKPEIWKGSCPVLFPICGGLKDNKYVYAGKEYTLEKHGYARNKVFAAESVTDNSIVFLHCSDADTKLSFPFDYELRISYTLSEKTVKIDYSVINKTEGTMYFNIGSHEGYYTPEGIEDYDLIFPEKETLSSSLLCGNLLTDNLFPVIKDSEYLPLYDKYFTFDALVFKNIKSREVLLRNRKTGRALKVDFPDDKYFLIWHKHGAPFICLEPWNGIPDTVGSGFDITKKEGITPLAANCEYKHTHSITVF